MSGTYSFRLISVRSNK